MSSTATVELRFIDLQAQRNRLGDQIDHAISRVLEHGQFVMGPEVGELEWRLAEFCGADQAVACSSGTDALLLALMALHIGPGDAVIVPAFTFAATAEVVALVGATPVFVDVLADTANLDPAGLAGALDAARIAELSPRAVIAVDLFGQPADYDELEPFCAEHELVLIADAAQSFGAAWGARRCGAIGEFACTSFFPSKPLGCYGDGGAVFTDDAELAARVRSLRAHGQGTNKYDNVRLGINGRLDTIQAAVLLEKLTIFPDELDARERVARRYQDALAEMVGVPVVRPEATSTWAQYTILVEDRDDVATRLEEMGVPTAVYYARPLHRQPAYVGFPRASNQLRVSEHLADRVLSLPMHPYLDQRMQDHVIASVRNAISKR